MAGQWKRNLIVSSALAFCIYLGFGLILPLFPLYVEQLKGGFKLSFRSRCELDCSEVAREFGGGGHKAAAGAFIDAPFEVAQQRVLGAVRNRMSA